MILSRTFAVALLGSLPLASSQLVFQSDLHASPASAQPRFRVAIIGAGASGSSSAFFLHKANELLERDNQAPIEITVFERDERIGGRTAVVHPYDDESYPPVELGASIFADVNRNLVRAVKDFNLSTGANLGEDDSTVGIWDGQQFLFEGLDDGLWNSARMLFRYGYSPITANNVVSKLVSRFLELYDPSFLHSRKPGSKRTRSGFPWSSIEELADALNFSNIVSRTAYDFFFEKGVSKLFIEEIIEAATRVNYGQNVDAIHAIGGGASMAATGATGVWDGNFRIFEEMLARSGAKVRMGVHGEVTGLIKYSSLQEAREAGKISDEEFELRSTFASPQAAGGLGGTKWWVGTRSGFGALYDVVIIGTPWRSSGISLVNTDKVIPTPEYVHLHVTLLVTNASQPDYKYFGRGKGDDVPKTVLTSYESVRKANQKHGDVERRKFELGSFWAKLRQGSGATSKKPKLEFNSLNYLSVLPPRSVDGSQASDLHVVKIFSSSALDDAKLAELFGPDTISWVHRKEWDAYPYLRPTTSFPSLEPDANLFFVNALESLVSTMETSTVAAKNVVALLLERTLGADFVHGGEGCERGTTDAGDAIDWAGWGCFSG